MHPMHITIFQLLTIGGTALWSESDDLRIIEDILEPNGIILKEAPFLYNGIQFCPVDTEKTTMNDFYKWEEISKEDQETFCWRTFYVLGQEGHYRSWLPIPKQEKLGPYSFCELFDQLHKVI